jgi:hypothetical protein
LGYHCPGDGDYLPLALAQVGAPLGEHGVVALRQVRNELVGVGLLGGLDAFLLGSARTNELGIYDPPLWALPRT